MWTATNNHSGVINVNSWLLPLTIPDIDRLILCCIVTACIKYYQLDVFAICVTNYDVLQ